MAIDEYVPYAPTTNLVNASTKTFAPLRIPVSHWQLRHYISSPAPNTLYYASGADIFHLDTLSKKRKHIATLPFEARCTASGHGWVCVGGEEEGCFAAINVGEGTSHRRDVDERLAGRRWSASAPTAPRVRLEKIGEEIVNSISVHRLSDPESHLEDVVAVLTNNDNTVRVYSLAHHLETTVLDLPFAMNHATISPDGKTLVAVGDLNQAYFFTRQIDASQVPQIPKPHNRLTSAAITWALTSVITLHVVHPETTKGYFTTAWSPSGRLVAVGSEGGYITVFDTEMLADSELLNEDAVVAVVPGTRSGSGSGAVRGMMFSPEPWDLLVWAEDQGRVVIGDLRTGLKGTQVVELDPHAEGLTKCAYEDIEPAPGVGIMAAAAATAPAGREIDEVEREFLRRNWNAPNDSATVDYANEYIEARRRQRRLREQAGAPARAQQSDSQGLTAREQQILDSLRTSRQREEARARAEGGGATARGVNYTSERLFTHSAPFGTLAADSTATVEAEFPELERTSGRAAARAAARREADVTLPPLHTLPAGDYAHSLTTIHNHRSTLPRASDSSSAAAGIGTSSRLPMPRRRGSVILSSSSTTPSPHPEAATSESRISVRLPPVPTPTALPQPPPPREVDYDSIDNESASASDNPWRIIEQHLATGTTATLTRGPLFESAARAPLLPPVPPVEDGGAEMLPEEYAAYWNSRAAATTITRREVERERPSEATLHAEITAERARARQAARQRERERTARREGAAPTTSSSSRRAAQQNLITHTPGGVDGPAGSWAAQLVPPLERFPSGYETLLRRGQQRGFGVPGMVGSAIVMPSGPPVGARTAGLAFAEDGRSLWMACEEGLFEVQVAVKGRGFWPGIEMR